MKVRINKFLQITLEIQKCTNDGNYVLIAKSSFLQKQTIQYKTQVYIRPIMCLCQKRSYHSEAILLASQDLFAWYPNDHQYRF